MKVVIPDRWREAVAAILEEARPGTIWATEWALSKWENLDNAHFEAGLYSLLAEELSVQGALYGKKHTDMEEDGECYSFTFRYHPPSANGEIELYTKLNLLTDGQVVIVYSAHT